MTEKTKSIRLNLTLPPDVSKRLQDYMLKVANEKGKIPFGLIQSIGRRAFKEFLDNHENDPTLNFDEE